MIAFQKPNYAEMKLYEGAGEILENIESKKILLTHQADPDIQYKKIAALGIKDLFDEVIIVSTFQEKFLVLEKIKSEFLNPKEVAVVGDRRDAEIRFGNMQGFVTILIKQGKYRNVEPKDDLEIPTYEIKEFKDLSLYIV